MEEEVVVPPAIIEEESSLEEPVVPNPLEEQLQKETEARRQLTARATRAESEKKALEEKLNKLTSQGVKPSLDVEDYIDISASLEGLDQREKERIAYEHKLTGKPLKELRNDEDFKLWQSAHRDKVEKERLTLHPSSTQTEGERPRSLEEQLANATLAEKEKILNDLGLYKQPRPRSDRTYIGTER